MIGKCFIANKIKKGQFKKDSALKFLKNGITAIKFNDEPYKEGTWSILPNNRIMINGLLYIIQEISKDEITLYSSSPLLKSDFED